MKHLDSPHLDNITREMIQESPEEYKLRKSLRGCIKVDFAGMDTEWHYRGLTVWYDESDTYSKYQVQGAKAINGHYEKLGEALDAIDRHLNEQENAND